MRYVALAALLAVTACQTVSNRPMSTAEIRHERIAQECRYEASKAGGYDVYSAAIRRGEVYRQCMELRAGR